MLDRLHHQDFLADILAHIEAHCCAQLSVGELAGIAGLSPYHFSRLFTARFGESVMAHVRNCRLQIAARRLAGDVPPALIDLALDCGFESQQAFTRAFTRRFGISPGRFANRKPPPALSSREIVMTAFPSPNVALLDDLVHRERRHIAGVRASFDQSNKSGIPALWPRLIAAMPLPGQTSYATFGASWMEDSAEGRFCYLAGVETPPDAPLPEGFERIALKPQSYAVFRLTLDGGPLHPQMQAALAQIWGELLPRSGHKIMPAPDLEVYAGDFEPLKAGALVDFWLPIEAP